jgi:hypothetical protein
LTPHNFIAAQLMRMNSGCEMRRRRKLARPTTAAGQLDKASSVAIHMRYMRP